MKKILLTTILTFTFLFSKSQVISFPDSNLKTKLLASNPNNTIATNLAGNYFEIDANNNNEIELTEALQVEKLDVSSTGITNLIGITNFTNLKTLLCENNQLTNLNLNGLTNLEYLYCSNNSFGNLDISYLTNLKLFYGYNCQLTSLNLTGLTNLDNLICNYNQIADLDLSSLNNLTSLACDNNPLQTLDVNNLIALEYLNCANTGLSTLNVTNLVNLIGLGCYNNQLTSLDVSNNANLTSFSCSYNQLTNIDLTNLTKLHYAQFSGNLFTELNFSNVTEYLPSSTHEYNIEDNPNLTFVSIKNGQSDYVYFNNGPLNCPNLHYICADEIDMPNLLNGLQQANITSIQANTYCTFSPGGVYNTISGHLTFDIDNNGCAPNDLYFPNTRIDFSNGENSGASFTSPTGTYEFYATTGSFTITPNIQNSNFFTISPPNATLNFPAIDGSTQIQNFCITPNGIHKDIDVAILPIIPARPGFDATYQLIYTNKGNQTLSGDINFDFNDAVLDFVSANPAIDNQTINNLSWNYSNLYPFETRTINLTLNVNAPTEIPPVNINDTLAFTAVINPIVGDDSAIDNSFDFNQIVVGSYDPNDKICLEGETINPARIGDYLHYIIHFQNSGTAPAENIVVKDIIDTTKFDISTLKLTSSSHPQITKISGNKTEFYFEGINLPAEQDNEPASHGYIAFKIKTKSNLVTGNTVSNTANIYFDYNFPIVTNTVTSTFSVLDAKEFENKTVTVFPNPTKNSIMISAKDKITSIQLLDVQGRLIETKLNSSNEFKLDLTEQNSGIYFVKVITEKGIKIEKIMKD